jgi:hypothetical protein
MVNYCASCQQKTVLNHGVKKVFFAFGFKGFRSTRRHSATGVQKGANGRMVITAPPLTNLKNM